MDTKISNIQLKDAAPVSLDKNDTIISRWENRNLAKIQPIMFFYF